MNRRRIGPIGPLALGVFLAVGAVYGQDVALRGEAEPQIPALNQFLEKMIGVQLKSLAAPASCTAPKGVLTLGHPVTPFLGDSGSCYQDGVWIDLWTFSAQARNRVRVSFTTTHASLATIQDYATGTILAASSDTCGGLDTSCTFEYTILSSGQYFLGFGSFSTEQYTLSISLASGGGGGGGGAGVNLAPYKPVGWSDKIVLSTAPGTNQDASSFESSDRVYMDFAVANTGTSPTNVPFDITLRWNGAILRSWSCNSPLNPNSYCYVEDVVFSLEAGTHTFSIEADHGNTVVESNDYDNAYSRSITVGTSGGSSCDETATSLCLTEGRFSVAVNWSTNDGRSGQGHAIRLSSDTGYFWFFSSANVELCVKVLDGRSVNGHFWVFYGALSNVHYRIVVTDTQNGGQRIYENPQGTLASVADTSAF